MVEILSSGSLHKTRWYADLTSPKCPFPSACSGFSGGIASAFVRLFKLVDCPCISWQQSGAVEACWAHNPEVRGSKPRSAKSVFSGMQHLAKVLQRLRDKSVCVLCDHAFNNYGLERGVAGSRPATAKQFFGHPAPIK